MVKSTRPALPLPSTSYYDYVFKDVDKYKDRVALVDVATGQHFTYEEVHQAVKNVAVNLTATGVTKNTVFAIFAPNSLEYVITFYAAHYIGAVVVPINCLYTERELLYNLCDCSAEFIICGTGMESMAISAARKQGQIKRVFTFGNHPGCTSYSYLIVKREQVVLPTARIGTDDLALIPFSSGTTGLPKGVLLTNKNLIAAALMFRGRFPLHYFEDVDRPLLVSPLSQIQGIAILTLALSTGQQLVVFPRFDFELFLHSFSKYKTRAVLIAPAVAVLLVKSPLTRKYDLSSVQEIICGSAPMSKEMERKLKCIFKGATVCQLYGMTETGVTHLHLFREEHSGSVGKLVSNAEAKILDVKTGQELGCNKEGEVLVRAPGVMKGYLNRPAATASTLDKDGWIHTGDIGYYDSSGHLFIVDRTKDLIKVKGYQVSPSELEAVILGHPEVADVGVIGVPDSDTGEAPLALVVKNPGACLTERKLIEFVAGQVASFKRLRGGVQFVEQLPKSGIGKILRRQIKEQLKQSKL